MNMLFVQDPSYDWCRLYMDDLLVFEGHNSDLEPYTVGYYALQFFRDGGHVDDFDSRWVEYPCNRDDKVNVELLWEHEGAVPWL